MILWLLVAVLIPQAPARDADAMRREIVGTGWLTLDDVTFVDGTAKLQPKATPMLNQLAALLEKHDEWRFEVQAHAAAGSEHAAGLALAEARARAVVAWLTAHRIAATRLVAKGYAAPDADRRPRLLLRKINEE